MTTTDPTTAILVLTTPRDSLKRTTQAIEDLLSGESDLSVDITGNVGFFSTITDRLGVTDHGQRHSFPGQWGLTFERCAQLTMEEVAGHVREHGTPAALAHEGVQKWLALVNECTPESARKANLLFQLNKLGDVVHFEWSLACERLRDPFGKREAPGT